MDDLTRLRILLDGKSKPDLSGLSKAIGEIFDTDKIKLRKSQKDFLAIITKYRRGFGALGVGEGKTPISFLAPILARSHRALVMMPANLVDKTIKINIPDIESWFNLKLDWCSLAGKSQHQRRHLMNKHRITIFPYSLLSTEDTEDLLAMSNADLIVCDESHSLKDEDSAKTDRFLKFIDKNPNVGLICMSGTIIDKSLFDYWHLICRSIKHLAPIPFEKSIVQEIQDVTDYSLHKKVAPSKFLCKLAPELKASYGEYLVDVEKTRAWLRVLFKSSPATLLTENQSVNCSIFINVIEVDTPKPLLDKINEVKKTWCTPSGDELEDNLSIIQLLQQLSSGFYYRLYWGEDVEPWVLANWKAENELKREIRHWIRWRKRSKLDTPGLVKKALESRVPTVKSMQEFYDKWKASFEPGKTLTERTRARVWESDYKINEARKWASTVKNGIIWYGWDESGLRLSESMPNAIYCPANVDVLQLTKSGILICSLAHAQGQNLQHHCNNLLFDLPDNGAEMEQLIGRTHRQGQMADCVNVDILVANDIDKNILKKIYLQSKNLHVSNQQQKFIIADWSTDEYVKLKDKLSIDDTFDVFSDSDLNRVQEQEKYVHS